MTSKEGIELSYLNIRIIKYPYGLSIDQTSQIQDTILLQWFPYASDKVKSAPTPFKVDRTFELDLAEILPATPSGIHLLDDNY